jgi:serine/threonine protein phosphatase PrpC
VSVLLVCSDGIWDNWKYPDVIAACLQKDLVQPSLAEDNGKKATEKLMSLNLKRAKENFGSQADNMTAILCHLSF